MNANLDDLFARYPSLTVCADAIQAAQDLLVDAFAHGRKLLLCGNGGSASDCDHIAGELMKAFLLKRPLPAAHQDALRTCGDGAMADRLQCGFPCVALTGHAALNTAVANDVAAELVFAQQTYALGQAGDVLWGLSTSGNSANVVNAFKVARIVGLRTLAFTGQGGGKLAGLADVAVRVPATRTPDVQELHLPVYHALCAAVEAHFFGASL